MEETNRTWQKVSTSSRQRLLWYNPPSPQRLSELEKQIMRDSKKPLQTCKPVCCLCAASTSCGWSWKRASSHLTSKSGIWHSLVNRPQGVQAKWTSHYLREQDVSDISNCSLSILSIVLDSQLSNRKGVQRKGINGIIHIELAEGTSEVSAMVSGRIYR